MDPVTRVTLKDRFKKLIETVKSKRKIVGGVLGILVLVTFLASGVYLIRNRQSTKTEATNPELSLYPNGTNFNIGDTFEVAVSIDTKGMSVSAADLKVRYETNKLEALSVVPIGDFLPTVLLPGTIDSSDPSSGRASITLGALINETGAYPKSGIGALAQITFKAKAAGSTDITFGDETAIAAVGQNVNVVGTKNPAQIDVAGTVIDPTATSEATPTTIAQPTPTTTSNPETTPTATSETTPLLGNFDGDGDVDIIDLGILIDNYAKNPLPNPDTDLDGDGDVDIVDLGILIDNYGG